MIDKFVLFYLFVFILRKFMKFITLSVSCFHNRPKFSTCPDNMVNFGPLTAEIGSGVWVNPTNFNGFCVLAALLHGI